MVRAGLSEALVEGMCDDIVVMIARCQDSVEEGLQIKPSTHSSQFGVAQPQLGVRETGFLPVRVERVERFARPSSVIEPPLGSELRPFG